MGAHGVYDPLSVTLLRSKDLENLLPHWSHWSSAAHFPDLFEINIRNMAEKSHTPRKVQHKHVKTLARSRRSLYIKKCMQKSSSHNVIVTAEDHVLRGKISWVVLVSAYTLI